MILRGLLQIVCCLALLAAVREEVVHVFYQGDGHDDGGAAHANEKHRDEYV